MIERTWKMLPHFLLRSTGFPFAWLEQLTFVETAAALDILIQIEEEIVKLQSEVEVALGAIKGPASLKLRRRCYDRVHSMRSIALSEEDCALLGNACCQLITCWNALLTRQSEQEARARVAFATELPLRRATLKSLVSDPRFQEAVWLSSPQMFSHGLVSYLKHWTENQRPSKVRHVERQLISYLQRFCAKNDTASFFGPLNYGDFTGANTFSLTGPGAEHIKKREAFIAYWGVSMLARAIASDITIQPYLRPYHSPLCELDAKNKRIILASGERTFVLSPSHIQLLLSLDGNRTITQVATMVNLPIEQVIKDLQHLARAHVVVLGPEVPVTEIRALEWLISWVERLPENCASRSSWLQTLEKIKWLQDRFAIAPFEEKQHLLEEIEAMMAMVTEEPVRRGGGAFYADRLVIYEECLGGMSPLPLGQDCAKELQSQLEPVLNLAAAHGCALHQELKAFGTRLLTAMAPDGRMPFLSFVKQISGSGATFEPPQTQWQQAILGLIQEHAQEKEIQLDLAMLPPIDPAMLNSMALIASPDIMFLARNEAAIRAGDFQVVFSECHDTLMIWGWALHFHERNNQIKAEAEQLLHSLHPSTPLTNVLSSKRVKIVPFEYPGPTIEVLAKSQKLPEERIAITRVMTSTEEGYPSLQAPNWPRLTLYNGELPTIAHAMFSLPRVVPPRIDGGMHTPRIVLGKAILQREQWHLPREAVLPGQYQGDSFELMRDFWRKARQLGMPRYLFVRVKSEPKPVLVDSHNYFLLELLNYLLAREEQALFSEMLPTPDQLWLQGESGRYCAELRLSMCYACNEESQA